MYLEEGRVLSPAGLLRCWTILPGRLPCRANLPVLKAKRAHMAPDIRILESLVRTRIAFELQLALDCLTVDMVARPRKLVRTCSDPIDQPHIR